MSQPMTIEQVLAGIQRATEDGAWGQGMSTSKWVYARGAAGREGTGVPVIEVRTSFVDGRFALVFVTEPQDEIQRLRDAIRAVAHDMEEAVDHGTLAEGSLRRPAERLREILRETR